MSQLRQIKCKKGAMSNLNWSQVLLKSQVLAQLTQKQHLRNKGQAISTGTPGICWGGTSTTWCKTKTKTLLTKEPSAKARVLFSSRKLLVSLNISVKE